MSDTITAEEAQRFAVANKHIPEEEIKRDIADTEAEILQMKREIEGLRLIGDRMSNFRADGKVSGIGERQIFIAKLRAILELRQQEKP